MDLEAEESDALLLPVATPDRSPCKRLGDAEDEGLEPKQQESETSRRRMRLHRMDVACLAVVMLVACIITVRQPTLRTENPLLLPVVKPPAVPVSPGFVAFNDLEIGGHRAYKAAYNPRSFTVDGRATLLLGTAFSYANAEPETWESLLLQAKSDGNNVVAVNVSWEQHELRRGVFNLAGGANLTRVYELAARVGVFVHVRIHPRDCSQSVDTTSGNAQEWREEVERFVTVMVAVSRPFLASNGGPIILTELVAGECSSAEGSKKWTGEFIGLLNTSTPWITEDLEMTSHALLQCTDPRDCEQFAIDQRTRGELSPLVWARPHSDDRQRQTASQLAYRIARWFAIGGTAYIDQPDNKTDSRRQSTSFHLSKLRHVLRQCSNVLTSYSPVIEAVDYSSLTPKWQRALVFAAKSSDQVAFLENADDKTARVAFHGVLYHLSARSVVVIRSNAVVFNTSDVREAVDAAQDHRVEDASASIVATSR